jgi:hypothetical protein
VSENVYWETAKAVRGHGRQPGGDPQSGGLDQVIALAEELGSSYVWLGAKRNAVTGVMDGVTARR